MLTPFHPFPQLSTPRLKMREVTLDDDQEVFFQRSDATMNKYVDRAPAQTVEDARKWIQLVADNAVNNLGINWGLTLQEDDTLIGGFCFWNLSPEHNKAEIGFGIHPDHWGKGLMQEAMTAALQFGFEQMQVDTIEAYTHPDNAASVKLLERNGFTYTGMADGAHYAIYKSSAKSK